VSLPVRYQNDQIEIVDPRTGEFVALRDATLLQIAAWRNEIRVWEDHAKDAKRAADDEVIGRLDAQAKWTERVGPWTLSAPSPEAAEGIEWDGDGLWYALTHLEGLDENAVRRAVAPETIYPVRLAGVKALRKLGRADVNKALDEHSTPVEKPRRVSVRRAA
jgi:hypothetical protein